MRYLTAFALAMLFAGVASSQGRFGIKAGPVFNYINTKGVEQGDYSNVKTGYTIGISYAMLAGKNFGIQPELNFTRLSADESNAGSTLTMQYFQLPVLLKAITNKENFSVYAGPQLGFLTKATLETTSGKSDFIKNMTETDFAAVIGVEYITTLNITVNARYVHGISNVIKAEYDSFKSRHQYAAVTVGYLFRNKKKQ
jgi:opacity protein-like surface antigen